MSAVSTHPLDPMLVARTRPPAKLNLFLEVAARRDDGFHDIDTVMVPIDWCDELEVRYSAEPGVRLAVDWLPSRQAIARELRVDPGDSLLAIPADQTNLVHRALTRFVEVFAIRGGFDCRLGKSIPAGAGLGGASSDAASALRCAAMLTGIDPRDPRVVSIGEEIGSDVPFFLGGYQPNDQSVGAARATGRGEQLQSLPVGTPLAVVVAFPAVSLSTALVYANCQIAATLQPADRLIATLRSGDWQHFDSPLVNRLAEPAKKIAPQIDEILKSMWQTGLRRCQLTGSGSACFAIIDSADHAEPMATQLRSVFADSSTGLGAREPSVVDPPDRDLDGRRLGVRIRAASSMRVPAEVELVPETLTGS